MKNFLIILLVIFNVILLRRELQDISLFNRPLIPQAGIGGAPPITSDENTSVVDIVNYANPSVATIALSTEMTFWGRTRRFEGNIGSGFVLSDNGYIATNSHVVSLDNDDYMVIVNNQTYRVENIYRNPANDLAILKINAQNLRPLQLGDSSSIQLGETVIAIGTPLGEFSNSVTTGVISGLERNIDAVNEVGDDVAFQNLIQTDAAINPGNSGGPLINGRGQVIGINTAIIGGAQNIGFSIPVNNLKEFATTTQLNL